MIAARLVNQLSVVVDRSPRGEVIEFGVLGDDPVVLVGDVVYQVISFRGGNSLIEVGEIGLDVISEFPKGLG